MCMACGKDEELLSGKIEDAFNKQINAEIYSSYLYLAMAAYFEDNDLRGGLIGALSGPPAGALPRPEKFTKNSLDAPAACRLS